MPWYCVFNYPFNGNTAMYSAIPWTAWILSVHLCLGREKHPINRHQSIKPPLTDMMENVIRVNEDARKHQRKRSSHIVTQQIWVKKAPCPLRFCFRASAKCRQCSLYTCKTASKRWKVNNFWWHLHILQYANERACKSQIARREREGEMERRRRKKKNLGGRVQSIVEKRGTDGGWCKLWMQPAISKRKRKAEKPQVMHIRLRICHIFLSWSVSKLIYNLASVCQRVTDRQNRKTGKEGKHFWSMSRCVELCCAVKHSLEFTWCVCVCEAQMTVIALLWCLWRYDFWNFTHH